MAVDPDLAPADAVVALRSLPRRYRALFAGLEDHEAPDDLAQRPGRDGWTPVGHIVAASRAIGLVARALDEVVRTEDPRLERAVVERNRRVEDPAPGGTVEERVSELGWEVDALVERAERIHGRDWTLGATVDGHDEPVTALDLLRAAVSAGIEHLDDAQSTLVEVRER